MKIRSIQTKIALISGLCVLGATAAVVGYGIVAANNSRTYVSEQVSDVSDRSTRERLQTIASTQAGIIRSTLDSAFEIGAKHGASVRGHRGGPAARRRRRRRPPDAVECDPVEHLERQSALQQDL